jgi:hypothetical protein
MCKMIYRTVSTCVNIILTNPVLNKIVILKLAVAKPLEKFPVIYAIFGSLRVYYGQPLISEV